ncbi:hypothetical protein [Natronospora cellulosivora (SeqCode)]
MEKKKVFVLLLCVLFVFTGLSVFAGEVIIEEVGNNNVVTRDNITNRIGLDLPTVGWGIFNDADEIIGWQGVNIAFGYSRLNYFEPLKYNEINPYWQWGTVVLVVPYVGVGIEYPIEVNDGDGIVSINGSINLVTVMPVPGIGVSYSW